LPNRISQIHVGQHSVWDVQFKIKAGNVTWNDPYAKEHRALLIEGGWNGNGNIQWVKSLRFLLKVFQDHIDQGISGFKKIDALHFVKLSIHKRGPSSYFAFQTQFYDELGDETNYIIDMFGEYGKMLEIVWRHCDGVTKVVDDITIPVLRPDFLDLVDKNITDNSDKVNGKRALMFYVANPGTSPHNVQTWKRDSGKLAELAVQIGETGQRQSDPKSDHGAILGEFLQRAGEILGQE
jgi:hypothetical protein